MLSQSIASIFVAYALDGMDSWIVYLSIPAFSYDVSMENETLNSCYNLCASGEGVNHTRV